MFYEWAVRGSLKSIHAKYRQTGLETKSNLSNKSNIKYTCGTKRSYL